ncbi:phage/plasmid primase, P4 family [Fructobacillus sp. M158]|uniref:phage/plasmid primase, P4 family n=1 Tax=Fructobacillus parabroussonetiae TaxID=2713174 RepID=UPI00200A2239|nr:phage/plasmid primase, P4 family [Fructobacillus parabroussonetiae]MCK8617799.1 phage/plasmid primase, P4 family [Fructobacillus parabroussonetiae]
MTEEKKLPPFIYLDDNDKEKVDQHKVVEDVFDKTHFFNTTKHLAGYYYNGQYWEQFKTRGVRDTYIKNYISNLLGRHATSKLLRDILELVLSRSLDDNKALNFDKRKSFASFKNTAVDGETMEFVPNSPKLYLLGGFDFEIKKGNCDKTKALFESILGENSPFMIEYVGSMFHRTYRPFQYMVIIQGKAGSGKSYLAELIRNILGKEMTTSLSLEQISQDKFMTANLLGSYANIKSDLNNDFIPTFEVINNLTGSDSLQVQFKGENSFAFVNHAKLLFTANEAPAIKVNEGIRRRVKILNSKAPKHVTEKNEETDYSQYMEERSAFAYYAMHSYMKAIELGDMSITDDIRKTTDEWFVKGDAVENWANEHLQSDENINQRKDFIYTMFSQDLIYDGEKNTTTRQKLYKRLEEIGYSFSKARSSTQQNDDTYDKGTPANRIIGYKYVP